MFCPAAVDEQVMGLHCVTFSVCDPLSVFFPFAALSFYLSITYFLISRPTPETHVVDLDLG